MNLTADNINTKAKWRNQWFDSLPFCGNGCSELHERSRSSNKSGIFRIYNGWWQSTKSLFSRENLLVILTFVVVKETPNNQ